MRHEKNEFKRTLFALGLSGGKTPSTAKKAKKRTSSTDSESSASATKKPKSAKKKSNGTAALDNDADDSGLFSSQKKKSGTSTVSNFLNRPTLDRPASPTIDISTSSQILRDKDIQASTLKFGFLGLGIMGSGIVKNLLNSGHSVTVWNRTAGLVTNSILFC